MNQKPTSRQVNPGMVFPPSNGKRAIPYSTPGVGYNGSALIDSWAEAPDSGTYVLGSVNGNIQWIATSDCDATPAS